MATDAIFLAKSELGELFVLAAAGSFRAERLRDGVRAASQLAQALDLDELPFTTRDYPTLYIWTGDLVLDERQDSGFGRPRDAHVRLLYLDEAVSFLSGKFDLLRLVDDG